MLCSLLLATMPTDYGAVSTTDEGAVSAFRKSRRCHDVLFGLLFWIHVGLVLYAWVSYETADIEVDYADRGVWKFVGTTAAVALILSTLSLFFMAIFADELVEIALVVSLLCTASVTAYGFYIWKIYIMVVGSLCLLASIWFTCSIWKRIPFAAANLKTAIRAVRTNFGLIFVSYCLEVVAFGWLILWVDSCGASMDTQGWWMVFVYLLSLFWTEQVINNLQHTIVSSVIGTWWYKPTDANFCWDDGLNRAICHSLTYSFGSICFGSLLASIVQAIKWTHRLASQGTNRCARCIAGCIDCILSCIQDMIEYFNKWYFLFGAMYFSDAKPRIHSHHIHLPFHIIPGPLPLSEFTVIATLVRDVKSWRSSSNVAGRV